MDAEAFSAYVLSNAPRYEIEVLEKIAQGLRDNIASRRWGKPIDLHLGSNVEATMFEIPHSEYGTVVGMSEKACTIETVDANRKCRILYQKYAIRVLNESEWNRVLSNVNRWNEEYSKTKEQEAKEDAADRASAVRDRDKARGRAKSMEALNGTFEIYRGAFVHAFRPDWNAHEYGVVVAISPKKIVLSNEESKFLSTVWVAKHEIQLLDEAQWAIVEREQRRRRAEYDAAETAGRVDKLPDYSRIEIPTIRRR